MSKGQPAIPPLTKEEPVIFRPSLAAVYGVALACLVERAHKLQCLRPWVQPTQFRGREVQRTMFSWPSKDRENLAGWTPRQVRRIFKDLAERSSEVTVNPSDEVPLWQHSARDEDGTLSRDWFSVNYPAIRQACRMAGVHLSDGLFDPVGRGRNVPEPRTFLPEREDISSAEPGRNVRENRPALLSNSSLNSLNSLTLSLPPSARAREALAILQSGEAAAAAVDALVALGFDALDAAGLVGRWPDGAERARVMAANVELLRAAGPDYFQPWPPRGYVVKGMREAWPTLTAAEAAGRVAAHRVRAATASTPHSAPAAVSKDEALRQRIEAAGRRL